MTLQKRAEELFRSFKEPSKEELKVGLESLGVTSEEIRSELDSPGDKPYYRKLLYQDDEVELLVMNWSELECAPHDHGSSHGWIQVLNGTTVNTIYEVSENQLPKELFTEYQEQGKFLFAPKKSVHKMKDAGGTDLVTLHLYSPPITGMKVYDLETCAACVVSDDCGAWWPEEQRQKVKEIQLEQHLRS